MSFGEDRFWVYLKLPGVVLCSEKRTAQIACGQEGELKLESHLLHISIAAIVECKVHIFVDVR